MFNQTFVRSSRTMKRVHVYVILLDWL